MDNISLKSMFHWLSDVGFQRNVPKR